MKIAVICDKCGYNFEIGQSDFEKIRRDDIIVQYFRCPACLEKYHFCTTNPEMRGLIAKRLEIQNKIATGSKKALPVRTAYKLKHRLDKVIARQKKLMPNLKKIGKEILNGGDNTE